MALSPNVRRALTFGVPTLLLAGGGVAAIWHATHKSPEDETTLTIAPAPSSTARATLGFALRDADPERPAARTAIAGTPLSQADTDQLLGRLPKLASTTEGAVPFARRAESLKAPRPGTTIAESFPPASSNAAKTEVTSAKLTVLRTAPDGDIETAPNVSITFSEPMVPVTSHAELAAIDPPLKISPLPKGSFRWLGTQTLVFQSEVELPRSTVYTAEIPKGTKAISGHLLEETSKFTFRTPPAKLISYLPQGGGIKLNPVIFAEFDQRVDAAAILKIARLQAADQEVAMRVATAAEISQEPGLAERIEQADKHGRGRTLALHAVSAFAPKSSITVKFPGGTPSAEGPRVTEALQEFGFTTHGKFEIERSNCTDPCTASSGFYLGFSNEIDRKSFDPKRITVTPEVADLHVGGGGNGIQVNGKWKAHVTYKVTIARDLKDVFGQSLTGDDNKDFTVVPYKPQLFRERQPMSVLEPASKPHYTLFSTNEKTVTLKIYKVDPATYTQFQTRYQEFNYDAKEFVPQGALVKSETVTIDGKEDEITETLIDLAPLLKDGALGHLVVVAETTRPHKERWQREVVREWVQATHIGLSSIEARDGTASVYASNLADGAPLAGVGLAMINGGGTAQTEGDGRAHVQGVPRGSQIQPVLIARKGEDSTFLEGYSGRGSNEPATLRLFSFDDRGLYKPKETVRIKGIIRRVGNMRGGDVTVPTDLKGERLKYRVEDARGAEIAKGTAEVDDVGGLFVEFKLPDNANLGNANVEFSRGNDDSFTHSFRIDEFRRPEFEVSASVTTPTHYFGGGAVVETSAAYYAGGGLQAAETTYRVERSDGSFTPPNRSRFVFGRHDYHYWYARPPQQELRSAEWTGRTGAKGTHRLQIDLLGTEEPYPMQLSVNASVTDQNLQKWSTSTSLLVHPAKVYVGLRAAKPFVRAGDPIPMGAVVAGIDGAIVAGRPVHITSYRTVTEMEKGEPVSKKEDESACDWTSTSVEVDSACSLVTKKAGLYTVVADVTDDAGKKSRTLLTVWVTGEGDPRDKTLQSGRVELTADKAEYRVGDTAEILVHVPFAPAEGMLMVTQGAVLSEKRISFKSLAETITIPIEAGAVPSAEVHLTLVGKQTRVNARGDLDTSLAPLPSFAAGAITLAVPPVEHQLNVVAKPRAGKLAPGGSTTVDLSIADSKGAAHAGEAAVIVVDESVLSLAGYTLQDAVAAFFTSVGGTGATLDNRAAVVRAKDDQTRDKFGANGNMWGEEVGDSFGAGGLGLRGIGSGGGGRGEGIGLGSIGGIGHGAAAGAPPMAAAMAPPDEAPAKGAPQTANRARTVSGKLEKKKESDTRFVVTGERTDVSGASKGLSNHQATTPITMRTNFDALALFAGRVKTDEQGRASVDVKLPDSTTRYRVMAVVWDKTNNFGKVENQIIAQLPLTIRPSAPRFLNYGDTFELPIIVQNQSDSPRHVALALRTMNATLKDPLGRGFDVPANDRVELRIPAKALMPGRAHFQIAIGSDGFDDAADVDLPVWTPGTTEAFATYGVVDNGAAGQKVAVPAGIDLAWGSLDVATSSTALFALSDAILYLQTYPYDCNEQLSSRVLGIASLRDMLAAFHSSALPSSDVLNGTVATDLARLKMRQDPSSGGWGFWVGQPWPYLTLHVAFALSVAKAKGYAVDEQMMQRALQYLQVIDSHIPVEYGPEARRSLQAYAVFIQKRLAISNPERARQIIDEAGSVEKTPLDALAWLLPTLAADSGSADLVQKIQRHFTNRATETAGAAHFVSSYGKSDYLILNSDHRTDALILNALVETNPKSDLLPKIVSGLLGNRKKGHWENTQEDAFVLVALDAYFQKFEKVSPNFVARAWLGDASLQEHTFRGFNTDRAETSIPMAEFAKMGGGDFVVQKDGKDGRLYYRLGLRYAPSDLQLPALERGFTVSRRYEWIENKDDLKQDDQGVWHVKAGAAIRVRVNMVAQAERHHVALVDPMPAGFEAVNTALRGAPHVQDNHAGDPLSARSSRFGSGRSGFNWRYFGAWGQWYEHTNLRDERAEAFTSYLPAGVHEYVYTARATTTGNFVVPPAKAEEMYSPEVFGRSAGDRVVVE